MYRLPRAAANLSGDSELAGRSLSLHLFYHLPFPSQSFPGFSYAPASLTARFSAAVADIPSAAGSFVCKTHNGASAEQLLRVLFMAVFVISASTPRTHIVQLQVKRSQ